MQFGDLIQLKEGFQMEFKTSIGGLPKSLWETYSAFANTEGGTILLGVAESSNGEPNVVGLKDVAHMVKVFWDGINNRKVVSANILTSSCVSVVDVGGKSILKIDIPRANRSDRPVYVGTDVFAGTYRRNGEGDYKCDEQECLSMLRDKSATSADFGVVDELSLDALCAQTINDYRRRFAALRPTHPWNSLGNDEFLIKVNAAVRSTSGKICPTKAGLLMFGYENDILAEFPNHTLDYRKKTTAARWDDRVVSTQGTWSGNVFDFWQIVMPKILMGLPHPFALGEDLVRVDDAPMDKAVREAFANMIVNADYSGRGGVLVAEGADVITFTNPGMLRISKAELLAGGLSDPRNPILMKMFNLLGLTEKAGSGFDVMTQGVKSAGFDEVLIDEQVSPNRVSVKLPKISRSPEEVAKQEATLRSNFDAEVAEPVINKAKDKLSHEETMVVDLLRDNPSVKNAQVAQVLGVSASKARNVLRSLTDKGIIEPSGQNKARIYTLVM